jgi:hypothetical protein
MDVDVTQWPFAFNAYQSSRLMIPDGRFSISNAQFRVGRWNLNHTVEPVTQSIEADGEETRQSINPQFVY